MSGRPRVALHAIFWHLVANWGGAVAGLLYAAVTLFPRMPADVRVLSLQWAAGALFGSSIVVVVVLWLLARRADRVAERLAHGREVSPGERLWAARRLLRLPMLYGGTAFLVWSTCAVTMPLFFDAARFPARHELIHAIVAVVLVGFVAFTCELYLVERYVYREVLPAVLGEVPATRVPGGRTLSLTFRFGLLLTTTCVLPIVVLTFTAAFNVVSTPGTLLLGALFLCLGALQAKFIAGSVGRPLEALARGMARVQREELDHSVPVLSSDALGRLGDGFNQMVAGLRRAQVVKETFGRYVAPQVVEEILGGKIALGGEERFVTVLFSDIRGFTAMSEDLPPAEVVQFLNQFLDRMVEVLVSHGATIDKFIGDAVMATFGVPLSKAPEEDARAAVRAALGMVSALEQWNRERPGAAPLRIGIGVHSGEVVAGNIGSARRTEYTVIGDTVNTASRIETLTRQYDVPVLISEQTRALLGEAPDLKIEELPPAEVKGKRQPVRVFAVRATVSAGAGEDPVRAIGA